MPTLSMRMTAGIADNLMPSKVMAPKICANDASTLNTTKMAAQIDSSNMETKTKAANIEQANMSVREERSVMYCSQKMNGMPETLNEYRT